MSRTYRTGYWNSITEEAYTQPRGGLRDGEHGLMPMAQFLARYREKNARREADALAIREGLEEYLSE